MNWFQVFATALCGLALAALVLRYLYRAQPVCATCAAARRVHAPSPIVPSAANVVRDADSDSDLSEDGDDESETDSLVPPKENA